MNTTNIKSAILGALALVAVSFTATAQESHAIKTSESSIEWLGKKVTGEHTGTINFKEGNVSIKKGNLVGGSFVVDMTTINVTDLQGEYKGKLEGHLNSDDFFGVAAHPTATFVITAVNGKEIFGDLTIKGHTEKQAFVLHVNNNLISGKVTIDRTKFGIRYGSKSFFDNLKDKAISDAFVLDVKIKF
ncbi:YceI family protein [Flavobacteriaceae bacterium]|nr:YceI family protein [Flavobacteriaceae bacterium]